MGRGLNLVIGVKEDSQSHVVASQADFKLFWDDFKKDWDVIIKDDAAILWLRERRDLINVNQDVAKLYMRFPYAEEGDLSEVYLLLISLVEPEIIIGPQNDINSPTNKLSQLSLFGKHAPYTRVTNLTEKISAAKEAVTKSMSWLRSKVCQIKQIPVDESIKRTSTPVLMQEFVRGEEYKSHFLYSSYGLRAFTVRVELDLDAPEEHVDYRYQDEVAGYSECALFREELKGIAENIARENKINFFDCDYRIDHEGRLKILEWNDSPAPYCFESHFRKEGEDSFSASLFETHTPVILKTKEDQTGSLLSNSMHDKAVTLCFDDYGKDWTYVLQNGAIRFFAGSRVIRPTKIYLRNTNDDDARFDFIYAALDSLTDILVIGAPEINYLNGSKPLQCTTSLKKSLRPGCKKVRIPALKLKKTSSAGSSWKSPSKVVKSISGFRSIVVAEDVWKDWDEKHLADQITLFQNKVPGDIVRAHIVDKKLICALATENTGATDHRYANDRRAFRHIKMPAQVEQFCLEVAKNEDNDLIGIDFIKDKDGIYHCLEANPQPGWGWYVENLAEDDDFLASAYHVTIDQMPRLIEERLLS